MHRQQQPHELYRDCDGVRPGAGLSSRDPRSVTADTSSSGPRCSVQRTGGGKPEIRKDEGSFHQRVQCRVDEDGSIFGGRPLGAKLKLLHRTTGGCCKRDHKAEGHLVCVDRSGDRHLRIDFPHHARENVIAIEQREAIAQQRLDHTQRVDVRPQVEGAAPRREQAELAIRPDVEILPTHPDAVGMNQAIGEAHDPADSVDRRPDDKRGVDGHAQRTGQRVATG